MLKASGSRGRRHPLAGCSDPSSPWPQGSAPGELCKLAQAGRGSRKLHYPEGLGKVRPDVVLCAGVAPWILHYLTQKARESKGATPPGVPQVPWPRKLPDPEGPRSLGGLPLCAGAAGDGAGSRTRRGPGPGLGLVVMRAAAAAGAMGRGCRGCSFPVTAAAAWSARRPGAAEGAPLVFRLRKLRQPRRSTRAGAGAGTGARPPPGSGC